MNFQSNFLEMNPFEFKHPTSILIAGPSKSGKTTIISKIISQSDRGLVAPPPDQIVYCYKRWQKAYEDIKLSRVSPAQFKSESDQATIEFIEGMPDFSFFDSSKKTLLILDDLMTECGKSPKIMEIFTIDSHHQNLTIIFVTHNLFAQEKYSRTISLNCQYVILTNNPREKLQIISLAKQMFPGHPKFFAESFNDAVVSKEYGYLILDCTQSTKEENRVQTGIFENEERYIYRKL